MTETNEPIAYISKQRLVTISIVDLQLIENKGYGSFKKYQRECVHPRQIMRRKYFKQRYKIIGFFSQKFTQVLNSSMFYYSAFYSVIDKMEGYVVPRLSPCAICYVWRHLLTDRRNKRPLFCSFPFNEKTFTSVYMTIFLHMLYNFKYTCYVHRTIVA